MELKENNAKYYEYNNSNTWKTMYKLMLNLMKNKQVIGMGDTNDTNLIKLLQKNNKIKSYYNYYSSIKTLYCIL